VQDASYGGVQDSRLPSGLGIECQGRRANSNDPFTASFDGVEAGEVTAQEAFESTMLFQSKNKVKP